MTDQFRLEAELRAASVLLSALAAHQSDAGGTRDVFEAAVVRETAHMLERGVPGNAIRAFESAAGAWAMRSRQILAQASAGTAVPRRRFGDRSDGGDVTEKH